MTSPIFEMDDQLTRLEGQLKLLDIVAQSGGVEKENISGLIWLAGELLDVTNEIRGTWSVEWERQKSNHQGADQ